MKDTYENPLTTRYASEAMRRLFSPDSRYRRWRDMWIALARAEKELGLPITDAQIAELVENRDRIDYERVAAKEREIRHDDMAHIHGFGEVAPGAMPILHLGATSCFVTDNAALLLTRDALDLVPGAAVNVIDALAGFAPRHRDLPTPRHTTFNPAHT